MALIDCPECNKKISEKAKSCPECGFVDKGRLRDEEIKARFKKILPWIIIFGVFYLFAQTNKESKSSKSISTKRANEETVKYSLVNTLYSKVNSLNVRDGASTSHKKFGKIKKFESLKVEKESNGWIYFKKNRFPDGGWVNKKYLIPASKKYSIIAQPKGVKVSGDKIKKTKRMTEKPMPKKKDLSFMAVVQCKNYVKEKLISPSTADFPFFDFKSNHIRNDIYVVRSFVDSQNSFGATIRTRWKCKIQYTGGENGDQRNWDLLSMVMN